ncbi:MAG TPA: RidA family protein [Candidatus Dormibacteraeota bacterium]|nr:RidA family protein [Candidatus Dormibacteraeota bacterium]
MDRPVVSRHEIRNPQTLPPPRGFSHAVIAQPGRAIYLAGQAAQRPDGSLVAGTVAEQFDVAAANVVKALNAAGAGPPDLVSMQIFVTDIDEYRQTSKAIGEAYRRHFGAYYPAMALLEVRRLFDPQAKVELMCVAVTA